MSFKFDLSQEVKITLSGEKGYIKGRAEYANLDDQYWVHYLNAGGRSVEGWFYEDQLSQVESASQ